MATLRTCSLRVCAYIGDGENVQPAEAIRQAPGGTLWLCVPFGVFRGCSLAGPVVAVGGPGYAP